MIKQGLVIPSPGMSKRQLMDVMELARICNSAEKLELKLNKNMLENRTEGEPHDFLWYERGQLVGFLALYRFVPKEAEVGGMVHPAFRRKGIFTALTEAAMKEAKRQKVPSLMFVSPQQSQGAKAFLATRQAEYCYSEFGMRLAEQKLTNPTPKLTLKLGTPEERELMIHLDSRGFDSPMEESISIMDMILGNPQEDFPYIAYNDKGEAVGRINTHIRDGNAHFFSISVLPEYRRRGYGRLILQEGIRLAAQQGLKSMTLEVACENRKALNLYQVCGFQETYVNDYYSIFI